MKFFFLTSVLFCSVLSAQEADCERALSEYVSGQYEEALTSIELCIADGTTNYQYFALKGKILEKLYNYKDAIIAQQKAFQLNPESKEAQATLASLHLISGQPDFAAVFYEKLVIAEPSVNRWKISLATALIAAGKHQNALEQLKIVEQADSTNWLVYKYMGDCYFRLDSLHRTYDSYYKALNLFPYNKNLYGTFTRLLLANNEIDAVITIGREAVFTDTTNVEVWKNLGIAYYKLGRTRQSYEALRKAVSLGDNSFATLSHYGIINYHLFYYRQAEQYLERALQLSPNDITTMNYLASTYGFNGKAQKGLDVLADLDKIVANFDTIGKRANVQRAHLLRRLNRDNEAAIAYIAATKDFPNELRNFYDVAICYDAMRNTKLSLEWYSRYLEKVNPQWETDKAVEQELKKNELTNHAMARVKALRVELFFQEERKKK